MTKREAQRQTHQENTLLELGFTRDEAEKLRRISMTLHRWHELECGDSNSYGSWAIERDENGEGPPFMVRHHYRHGQGQDSVTRTPIADRETGARKRLDHIIAARNARVRQEHKKDEWTAHNVRAFIQTDPRGAALYLIRPGDVPEGADVSAYYTRGIVVY
jgi:hypothetical protein